MTLSVNQIKGMNVALSPEGSDDETFGRGANTEIYRAYFSDVGTATNDHTAEVIVKLDTTKYPNGAKVLAAYFAPGIAVTAHDTNNRVVTFTHETSAGASSTTIGTVTTNTTLGNLAAGQSGAATLTAANCVVPVGGSIKYASTHGGTGVICNGAISVTAQSFVEVVVQAL